MKPFKGKVIYNPLMQRDLALGRGYEIIGYKCNECGFVGTVSEFPSFKNIDENGLKEIETHCPKCESDDLNEITDDDLMEYIFKIK